MLLHRVAGIAVAFVVLTALFWVLQRIWPSIRGQRTIRAGFVTDCLYWVWTGIATRGMSAVAVALTLLPLALLYGTDLHGLLQGHGFLARQKLWLQAVAIFTAGDFLGYWQHRLFHRRPLWRFHAIHHSSRDLDWLSSVRVHPVNDVLSRMIVAVPLVAVGFNTTIVALYAPFATFYAILLHANLNWDYGPLRFVIASPAFHRWHHTGQAEGLDKNFAGMFPVWDLLFGTFYMPRGRQAEFFGVDEPIPDGFLSQMLHPFRRGGTSISRAPVPSS
jgi:sterol desaturase/sphingolipid hydroxylase (fatty acid hydroxylase superfamily)